MEIKEGDLKKHLEILGNREIYCVFGGRPEWDDKRRVYAIPATSPRKKTDWVSRDVLSKYLKENIRRGWTTWISLNEKEVGEDTIEGTSKIWCFWFDFDAPRADKSKIATEEEKRDAFEKASRFKSYMEKVNLLGFMACSGNGFHVFFPVEGYELRGKNFRKEFNQKQRKFYKQLREESGVDFDTTTDIRRVTQPIGYPNMKIPDTPINTYWVDQFTSEDIQKARKQNSKLIDAILDIELTPEVTVPKTVHIEFEKLLAVNKKVQDLYNGDWQKYDYKSRSEAEEALVTILCIEQFSDAEIIDIMNGCKIGKWQEKEESYHNLTIQKARKYVTEHKGEREEKKKKEKKGEKAKKTIKDEKKEATKLILDYLQSHYIFVTADDNEDIYVYDNGIYKPGELLIKAEVEKIIEDNTSSAFVSEIINHIKRRTYVPRDLFNRDKNILPVKNGLLNLKDFKLYPFDSSKIFTYQLPVEFNPNAGCPNIEKFISEVLQEDDIPLVQQFLGYCLYPDMPAHKSLWLYGSGRNGKTTFVNLIRRLLGDICTVSVPLEELDSWHRFAEARLYGKLLNIVSEPTMTRIMETTRFKRLIGGDLISAEIKNKQNPLNFVNFAKFIIIGNRFPKVTDSTIAFWERIIVVKFPRTFINDAIPNYDQMLIEKDGLSGFLNWCLEGLKQLQARNFQFIESKSSEEMKREFIRISDSVRAFITEGCIYDTSAYITKTELYDAYKDFCEREGLSIFGKKAFSEIVSEIPRIYSKHKKIGGKIQRCWFGIRVKEEREKEEEKKEVCDVCGKLAILSQYKGQKVCEDCLAMLKKDEQLSSIKSERLIEGESLQSLTIVNKAICERCGEKGWIDHEWVHEGKKYKICTKCVRELRGGKR